MATPTIFSRFLTSLGVPHTTPWSDAQFRGMTFKSLYGLSHLLTEYKVKNEGVRFTDKQEIARLTPPFLAQTKAGAFVIVTSVNEKDGVVTYDSRGEEQKIDLPSFLKAWNGIAMLAFPDSASREPEYGSHRLTGIIAGLSKYLLALAALIIFAYFFVDRALYRHVSTCLLTALDCAGLYFAYMLLQKSLNIHTAASDRVCGVLEQGGCDSIMKTDASKLFGVFSWSEVGFGYFGISIITLLLFPHMWPALALCNVCCLPYSFWSVWYQKFRAHHWCTLCIGVQAILWLLFFCYLGGGWLRQSWPLHLDFFILIAVYFFSVLLLNMILRIFKNLPCHENNSPA